MKLHFRNWISSNWPVFFLVVFEIVLAWKNIVPGTWLTGWDSTQPELNLKLNLVRSFTSVWQEYRGVGLPDGMAHAANIMHLFYVWLLSFVVPDNLVRYVFVFLSHLVGGIGVYKLLQHLLKKSNWLALAGAIFYLMNPITIQMFYQPLELFIIHFAGLPWLVLTLMKYIEDGGRKNLLWLSIVLLAFVSQNHVPTIFIVTMMAVGLILLVSLIASRGMNFKKVLAVVGVVLGINSFWLLPYMVTTVSNSQVIPRAKMNLLSNPEVILRNAEYGDLESVVRMQGFSLSYEDWHLDGPTGLQMPQWASWWNSQTIVVIMWVVFGLVLVGIIKSVGNRDWKLVSIGLIWIVALFNLGVRIPVIDQLMTWVYANVPLYAAVFRFAFTKFSIVFALTSTVLTIYALDGLIRKWGKVVAGMIVIGASLWTGWPVFNGNFIYKELRLNWPSEYKSLFNYFDKAEIGRIVRLPVFDLWGWESNSWGYRGSGVIWQGVWSPMLVRSFDPWSPHNEGFYNEFSNSLYACSGIPVIQCSSGVAKVLGKYDVRYVLLDESVIAPGQDKEILRIEETRKLAEELGWEKVFAENFLTVWSVPSDTVSQQFVSAPGEYSLVDGDVSKVRKDVVYEQLGTYVSNRETPPASGVPTRDSLASPTEESPEITHPFAGLMREEVPTSPAASLGTGMGVEYGERSLRLTADGVQQGQELTIPGWKVGDIVRVEFEGGEPLPIYYVNGEPGPRFLGKERPEAGKNIMYARVSEGVEWREYLKDLRFTINDSRINIEVPGTPQIYDFAKEGVGTIGNCDVLKRGSATKHTANGVQHTVYKADERGAVCDYVVMSSLDTRLPYLMRVSGENVEGRSIKFFLYNTGSKRNDIEYLLGKDEFDQTFSMLPWVWDGYYTLNIETRSFGQRAENIVEPIEARYFPLEQIAGARVVSDGFMIQDLRFKNNLEVTHVSKTGTWLYGIGIKGDGLIELSQGYDEGWVGLRVNSNTEFRISKLEHVKVDGWANGWLRSAEQNPAARGGSTTEDIIIIFYWPQLLQYLGFGLLAITIVVLVIRRK